MKKNIYIARSANSNTETCKAFFSKEEATEAAKDMFYHLTARERKEETVTVETYLVTAEEDDERTAEQLFNDLLDEESPEAMNAKESEEIRSIREISAYDAHEIAVHLVDGGWESSDKEQFAAENSREDSQNVLAPEAIDKIFSEIEEIEQGIKEQFYVDMDSFGQDCPENWEEIAAALNAEIDKIPFEGENEFRDRVDDLWERYCSNDPTTASIPRPVEGETVVNQFGVEIDFETAANLMDDEIREQLHGEGIESRQEFFDRYAVKHLQKFGEEWEPDKPNPQI